MSNIAKSIIGGVTQTDMLNELAEDIRTINVDQMIRLGEWAGTHKSDLTSLLEARNIAEDYARKFNRRDSLVAIMVETGEDLVVHYDKVWEDLIDAIDNIRTFSDVVFDSLPFTSIQNACVDVSCTAARNALRALLVRDVIDFKHYNTLTEAWRTIVGPIHPDDPEVGDRPTSHGSIDF